MKTMKTIKSLLIALTFVLGSSTVAMAQKGKKVDVSNSKIEWIGKKVTGSHNGLINLAEGNLIFKGSKLAGGNFTVDMTSINTTDLDGKGKASLDGHLKNDDFFAVEKFPTATIVFKKIGTTKVANNYVITADLTIKGITQPIVFNMTVEAKTATAKLMVDRTKYDIKYGSTMAGALADKAISDEFELNVSLSF